MEKLLEAIEKRLSLLPEGLRSHVERTRVMARDIGKHMTLTLLVAILELPLMILLAIWPMMLCLMNHDLKN